MIFVWGVPIGSVPAFLWTLLVLLALTTSDAFAPLLLPVARQSSTPKSKILPIHGRTGNLATLESSKSDDVDDWFADFDPSQFDKDVSVVKQTANTNDDRYSSGGGGRPYAQDRYASRPARSSSRDGRGRSDSRPRNDYNNNNGAAAGYMRDSSRDNSNVDVAAVEALIVERSRARQTGDFDRADAAKERLLSDHGVQIWDRDRVWRSGCSASGSGMQRPGGRFGGGGNMRDSGRGGDRRGRSMDSVRTPRDFGPKGHDYVMADDAGPIAADLSEGEIDKRIAERLQYKLSRNYDEADRIQNDLNSQGVYIIDRLKVWRADGKPFGDNDSAGRGGMRDGGRGGDRRESSRGPPRERDFGTKGHDYAMAEDAGPIAADLSEADIDELLAERLQYKFSRNYDEADRIKDELASQGVYVHDGQKAWRADGKPFDNDRNFPDRDRNSRNRPYEMSEYSSDENLSEDDVQAIEALVAQRIKAKQARDYDTADDLRYQLTSEYNVQVDDRLRQWSVGGNFGRINGDRNTNDKSNSNVRDRVFVRRGGGNLTNEQLAEIAELVQERDEAKRNFDYETADAIRDTLDARFSVRVDDRSKYFCLGLRFILYQSELVHLTLFVLGLAQVGNGE